jgi:hypothetical protein
MDHCSIAQHGQVKAVAVEGDESRAQLRDLVAESGDQLLLGPLAYVRGPDGVHSPVVQLPVRDEGADADDRVVDVLGKLVADRLADFYVRLADQIVGGREAGKVGHSLQVPHDDAWFHDRALLNGLEKWSQCFLESYRRRNNCILYLRIASALTR